MGLPMVEEMPGTQIPQMQGTQIPHEQERQKIQQNLANVHRKVGIHSGKGGVGKTFLAVNIAMALSANGRRVGLLDADVDCPNVAKFFNLKDVPLNGTPEGRISPLEYKNLKLISTHFMTDNPKEPMIVRGPIKHKVVAELLETVDWGELDVLLYDLPPGTADVPMSSMMIGDMDGIVVVTTPQKESIMDARKSALMARDLNVPVLGIVENMSGEIFGKGSGAQLASELSVPFLGSVPLLKDIRIMNEQGDPAFVHLHALEEVATSILKGVMGKTVKKRKTFWKNMFR